MIRDSLRAVSYTHLDKTIVERQILSHYGDVPVIKEKIKALKGITSFKEFGRLSKELLCELIGGEDPVTREVYTILNRLYHTNFNFNELLFSDTYRFNSAIEAMNAGKDGDVGYDDVKELYVSPMVRRNMAGPYYGGRICPSGWACSR